MEEDYMFLEELEMPRRVYTDDFNKYWLDFQRTDYRIDIKSGWLKKRYTFWIYKNLSDELLSVNGWTLIRAEITSDSRGFQPPIVELRHTFEDFTKLRIPDLFSKGFIFPNEGVLERRFRETFEFFQYISQFPSLDIYKIVHSTALDTTEEVMKYYLECSRVKNVLPVNAWGYIESTVRSKFEYFLKQKATENKTTKQ